MPNVPVVALDDVASPGTVGRRILDRMIALTVQDWPAFKGEDPSETLWRIVSGDSDVALLEVAVIATNLQCDVHELLTGKPAFELISGPHCSSAIDQCCPNENSGMCV